jgi:hypothetical protein
METVGTVVTSADEPPSPEWPASSAGRSGSYRHDSRRASAPARERRDTAVPVRKLAH